MNDYLQEPRMKKGDEVLKYWEKQKNRFPHLYKLAAVVMGVPSTQVSVERAFSSLKFVLSPQRAGMNAKVLEDVLLIRNNYLFSCGKTTEKFVGKDV